MYNTLMNLRTINEKEDLQSVIETLFSTLAFYEWTITIDENRLLISIINLLNPKANM